MSKLNQMAEEIASKRQALAAIFEKHTVNGELDMSMSVVEDVRAKNAELDDLSKKYEQVRDAERIAGENKAALERLEREPVGNVRFPVSQGGGFTVSTDAKGNRTLGEMFVASNEYKSRVGRHVSSSFSYTVEFPDADVKTTMTTSGGFPPQVTRTGILIPSAQRPLVVADLIPQGTTNQNAVKFMKETTFTNNAAERNENAALAESAVAYSEVTSPVQSLGTFIPVTEEQLDDVDGIQSLINDRLTYMVGLREDSQLLNGDGNAPNLTGFLNTGSIQTQAKSSDPVPDAVYKAMTKIATVAYATADAVVFNPTDWQGVRLLRTSDGIYIWGSPAEAGPERIWGLSVVQTTALAQGTALVGAFRAYSHISRRKGVTVEVGYINDDFQKVKKSIRAVERISLEVYRPQAFCTVTGL
jgi:HK97 family phage major capsid protein